MRFSSLSFNKILLVIVAFFALGSTSAMKPTKFTPRHIPLRIVELHAPRHTECQDTNGDPFTGPIPAIHPDAWKTSEWFHWVVSRMNTIYNGTGIQFWVKSHDVYCTGLVSRFLKDPSGNPLPEQLIKEFSGAEVLQDISLLYPLSDLSDLGLTDTLRRERWLQRAVTLYGDPHGMPVIIHSDYLDDETTNFLPYADSDNFRGNDFILPQHGYAPWDSPGMVFMFLSGFIFAPGWEFDPEMVLAHEAGHSLGNLHTHDFHLFGIGKGIFPDGSLYDWADFWDLIYLDLNSGPLGFQSRREFLVWRASNSPSQVRPIDENTNVILDPNSGWMRVALNHDPLNSVSSDTIVPSVLIGDVRLLQGLSFNLNHLNGNPAKLYTWQRNIMAYRYGNDSIPFDYLTARFSRSQIELMQRNLAGSTKFIVSDYGTVPPGKEQLFASRFNYLGDGVTEPFIWYSNGEGPASVNPNDDKPDMVAFRSATAGQLLAIPEPNPGVFYRQGVPQKSFITGDFNADGLTDLISLDKTGAGQEDTFLWSTVVNNTHTFEVQPLEEQLAFPDGYAPFLAGDFDGNGADDLFLTRNGRYEPMIAFFDNEPDCRFESCLLNIRSAEWTITVNSRSRAVVGNFDGHHGDDILFVKSLRKATYAQIAWSTQLGELIYGGEFEVGKGQFTPYAGDFNGTGGDDLMWHSAQGNEIFWWGAGSEDNSPEYTMLCGPGGSWTCVASSANIFTGYPKLTVGDFDGNGADDFMVHIGDQPSIYYSTNGNQLSYQGGYVNLRVALHKSAKYLSFVGEFDHAIYEDKPLGDDILLYFVP